MLSDSCGKTGGASNFVLHVRHTRSNTRSLEKTARLAGAPFLHWYLNLYGIRNRKNRFVVDRFKLTVWVMSAAVGGLVMELQLDGAKLVELSSR
jgi:hypothetical protein